MAGKHFYRKTHVRILRGPKHGLRLVVVSGHWVRSGGGAAASPKR
jgi:hypothetical protein